LAFPQLFIVSAILWTLLRGVSLFNFLWRHHLTPHERFQFFITDIWAAIGALLPSFFMAAIILKHLVTWPELGWLTLIFTAQLIGIVVAAMQLTTADPIDRT